jgi:hypothetical protein
MIQYYLFQLLDYTNITIKIDYSETLIQGFSGDQGILNTKPRKILNGGNLTLSLLILDH